MKSFQFLIILVGFSFLLFSCGGAETKADPADTITNKEIDAAERNAEEKISVESAPAAKPDSSAIGEGGSEILARIDSYLVSTPVNNSTVTVKNTLSTITFQKAIVEVTQLAADGKAIRSDYFTIQNIEPGDVETIKLTAAAKTASLVIHVVKVKSNTLTRGEMVLVGTHFEEGK